MGLPRRPFRAPPTTSDDPPSTRKSTPTPQTSFRLLPTRGGTVLPGVAEVQAKAVPTVTPRITRTIQSPNGGLTSPLRTEEPLTTTMPLPQKAFYTSACTESSTPLEEDLKDATNGTQPVPSAYETTPPALLARPVEFTHATMQGFRGAGEVRHTLSSSHLDHGMPKARSTRHRT